MADIIFPEGAVFIYSNKKQVGGTMHSHHYHDKFEIYYMISGGCNYFIDNKSYEVMAGDVVLIPEGIIHRTNYGGEEHARALIECSDHFIPKAAKDKMGESVYIFRNPQITRDIHAIFKKIDEEYKNPDEFSAESIMARMKLLFFFLARNLTASGIVSSKNAMIENVIGYIKQNFQQDIKLSSVAKSCFVSPEHLSRTFKRDTGFGFNEFLTLVRLQHAEKLLQQRGTKSISEIAYSCGFNDSNYFSDKFRRTYGISPLRYSKSFEL